MYIFISIWLLALIRVRAHIYRYIHSYIQCIRVYLFTYKFTHTPVAIIDGNIAVTNAVTHSQSQSKLTSTSLA